MYKKMEGVIKLERRVFKISIGQILLILIIIITISVVVSKITGGNENKEDNNEKIATEQNIEEGNRESVAIDGEGTNFVDTTVANSNFSTTFTSSEDANMTTETTSEDEIIYVTNVKDNGDDTYTLSGIKYKKYTLTASEVRYELEDGEISINGEVYSIQETDEENVYDLYGDGEEYPLYRLIQGEDRNYFIVSETELSDCWKLTEETVKVKVSGDIEVENAYEEVFSVAEVFSGMGNSVPEDSTHPNSTRTFRFEFKNGKCKKVYDVLTSM